jgi:predicted nucleic acid-binding protein
MRIEGALIRPCVALAAAHAHAVGVTLASSDTREFERLRG